MADNQEPKSASEAVGEITSGFVTAAEHYRQGTAATSNFMARAMPLVLVIGVIYFAFKAYSNVLVPLLLGLVATGLIVAAVIAGIASRKQHLAYEAMLRAEAAETALADAVLSATDQSSPAGAQDHV